MENNKNKPVQVVLTYNAGNSAKKSFHAKLVSNKPVETDGNLFKIDENHKLVRRYSFDDNGGGYSGL
jgi:hypothetical protein